ncbi:MAG: hypothetical protein AAGD11_01810 [Planctomycetota bacterium]
MPDSDHSKSAEREDRLEAFLDGLLSPDEAAEFKRIAANDPLLQREIELQQSIDASLARSFVAPTAPRDILQLAQQEDLEPVEPASMHGTSGGTSKQRRMVLMVLAASIAWAVAGWRMYVASNDDGYQELALADIYQECVDGGFQPKWVCDDDREFAETFQKRQGQPLLLKPDSQDLMVGLSYLKGISAKTTTMLARVEGEPVLVFVDSLDRDTKPEKPSWGSGLNLFRQELDGLVLYELSPLAEPRVLSNFYVPEELPAATPGDADSL